MKNIFTTKEQESIMDGYYYNGYYFLIPIWDTAPKGFEALVLTKGFVDLNLQNIEYDKLEICLLIDERLKSIKLAEDNREVCSAYIKLEFSLRVGVSRPKIAKISHKEKEEVIRLFNTIQESCISLNLNPIIQKLC